MFFMKTRAVFLFFLLFSIILNHYSSEISLGLEDISVLSNYQDYKQFIRESILAQKKSIKVQVTNYHKELYAFKNVINDLGKNDPLITYLFKRAYNGKVTGYQSEKKRVVEYDFEYRNAEKLNQFTEVPIIQSFENFKNIIKNDFKNFQEGNVIKIVNYRNHYDFGDLVEETLRENPGYGTGYKGIRYTTYGEGSDVIIELNYQFHYPIQQIKNMRLQADIIAEKVVSNLVNEKMNDYEKVLILHDYVVNQTEYDIVNYRNQTIPATSRSLYGVFVNGVAVCEGYANALKKLLDIAGVESMIVVGRTANDAHAWNLVKIGEDYYHVDATWNDPVTSNGRQILKHNYFNVTDQFLEKTHQWDKSAYPFAGSTSYNYENVVKSIENDHALISPARSLASYRMDQNHLIDKDQKNHDEENIDNKLEKENLEFFIETREEEYEESFDLRKNTEIFDGVLYESHYADFVIRNNDDLREKNKNSTIVIENISPLTSRKKESEKVEQEMKNEKNLIKLSNERINIFLTRIMSQLTNYINR